MIKTIEQLLTEHNSLIIPGFGSLIKSLSTGKVTFNEFLKFNDGILVEALITKSNANKEQALAEIKAFTEEVTTTLNSNKKFTLGEIGEFSKNDKGAIIFEGNVKANSSIKIPPVVVTPQKEPQIQTTEKPKPAESTPAKETSDPTKSESPQSSTPKPESTEKQAQVISKPVTMSSHSHNNENNENYVKLSQDEIEARHKKVALRGTIVFGILAIVIIWLFNYLNPHTSHENEHHDGTKTEEHGTPAHEVKANDEHSENQKEEVGNENAKEEAVASSLPTSANQYGDPTNAAMEQNIPVTQINNKFYVVSAAFADAAKAKHQARLLMIMDYKAVVIQPEKGKFYACTGAFNNYSDAQKALQEYKAKKADAWLYSVK